MDYYQVTWQIDPPYPGSEILIAELSEIGYESFEETSKGIKAYIAFDRFDINQLEALASRLGDNFKSSWQYEIIKKQNWNEIWESGYDPVVIRDLVYVHASFHDKNPGYRYQLEIAPMMSFGTAHHETTALMMEWMLEEDFSGKAVLDMGCGTGILAIFAELMGAKRVTAIDNNPVAVENARLNARKNNCKHVDVFQGETVLQELTYDLILANINRNVLLNNLPVFAEHLNDEGIMMLSGFYEKDLKTIVTLADKHNIRFTGKLEKNKWIAARFVK